MTITNPLVPISIAWNDPTEDREMRIHLLESSRMRLLNELIDVSKELVKAREANQKVDLSDIFFYT